MSRLKLTAVGTSTGIVIPKEMLARMKVERGDYLHVTEVPGGFLISPYDPAIAAQVEAGRELMFGGAPGLGESVDRPMTMNAACEATGAVLGFKRPTHNLAVSRGSQSCFAAGLP